MVISLKPNITPTRAVCRPCKEKDLKIDPPPTKLNSAECALDSAAANKAILKTLLGLQASSLGVLHMPRD